MSFHQFRHSFWPQGNLARRLWCYHDRNPLSPWFNLRVRRLLFIVRKANVRRKSRQRKYIYGNDNNLKVAPRLQLVVPGIDRAGLSRNDVAARFQWVHTLNEKLHAESGAWLPHELADYYGKGISIEEVALRIRGYLSAYKALNEPLFLERARAGGDYLVRERVFRDGHVFLQGHMTIDLPYSFAGEALLALWKQDAANAEYLEKAKAIGDQLVEYQIAGSVNHAVVPVQFLGQLYQATGNAKYLENAVARLMRTAVPMQLPYGGWLGHESWIWYHALILRSLIIGYVSLPNTLAFYAKRDKIACAIIAALNRMILCQQADGSFPIRPAQPLCESTDDRLYRSQKAVFTDRFEKVEGDESVRYGFWNGYVIDALVTAYELLDTKNIVQCLNHYAQNIVETKQVWRLEFDTLGAGRLLEYTHLLVPGKKDEAVAMIS